MKKIYITPSVMVVRLRPFSAILSTSTMDLDDTQTLDDSGDILTKGVVNGKSVWDEEW